MATFNASVTASFDDGCEDPSAGYTDRTGSLDNTNAHYYTLMRFQNVTIPKGSIISAATFTGNVTNAAIDSPNLNIYLEDIDDAPTISSGIDYNISARTRTTAYTAWNAADIGTGSKTSPDFAAALQEVIDRDGWASGNDIAIILVRQGAGEFRMQSYDTGTAPSFDATYSEGGGGAVKAVYYARMRGG